MLAGVLAACGGERATVALPSNDPCRARADGLHCEGDVALQCVAGETSTRASCSSMGQSCVRDVGCRTCVPHAISCVGEQRYRCSADGLRRDLVETCGAGLFCSAAGCRDLCGDARTARSYLGCEYWPVFTVNRWLSPRFEPAVAIGNGNLVAAHVKIARGTAEVATVEVAPRSSDTVMLAYDRKLQDTTGSALVRGGAYHLMSDVPVTVHQFNPLLFELSGSCAVEKFDETPEEGVCNSYTNDASLLFPQESLGPDVAAGATDVRYFVLSRASFVPQPLFPTPDAAVAESGSAGFVAIVAGGTQPVTVRVKSSAHTAASLEGEVVEALAPDDELVRTLRPGDVLQLQSAVPTDCQGPTATLRRFKVCDPDRTYDLTGTEVIADGPVEVLGGHDCSHVPFNRVACDHLEESLPPIAAWGTSVVLTQPRVAPDARTLIRVISATDGNVIRFDPPLHTVPPLNRGKYVEVEVDQPVHVSGTGKLLVAQYLIGQGSTLRYGDPSLTIGVPIDQYRTAYNFVTPATYVANYVDIIAATGDAALLDGVPVTGFEPVGNS
ncbi:MAG: IgGFc-binding protein, partial [Polyangiales bacterium]